MCVYIYVFISFVWVCAPRLCLRISARVSCLRVLCRLILPFTEKRDFWEEKVEEEVGEGGEEEEEDDVGGV